MTRYRSSLADRSRRAPTGAAVVSRGGAVSQSGLARDHPLATERGSASSSALTIGARSVRPSPRRSWFARAGVVRCQNDRHCPHWPRWCQMNEPGDDPGEISPLIIGRLINSTPITRGAARARDFAGPDPGRSRSWSTSPITWLSERGLATIRRRAVGCTGCSGHHPGAASCIEVRQLGDARAAGSGGFRPPSAGAVGEYRRLRRAALAVEELSPARSRRPPGRNAAGWQVTITSP